MYITNGSYHIKIKELTFDENINPDTLTLEQIGILASIPVETNSPFMVKYYGLTDESSEANKFKNGFKARKALKIVKKMYGDTFYIVKKI